MKYFIRISLFFLFPLASYTQVKPERAPLNPDFIKYVELSKEEGYKKSVSGKGLGYFPSYYTFHFNELQMEEESKKSAASLPSKYDLRTEGGGQVTPVKDQGPLGACWSFSTMGAIESNWLKKGYGSSDLSEQNMATCHGFTWEIGRAHV